MINRRAFLATTAVAIGSTVSMAEANASLSAASHDWLDRIRKSKAALFLDVNSYSRTLAHFDRATAYLEGEEVRNNRAVVVIGLHGPGLAHGLSIRLWEDWELPAQLSVTLVEAEKIESQFRDWLSEMARRYVGRIEVLACQRTLSRWASARNPSDLAAEVEGATKQVIPGVSLVPQMVTASAIAQHAGSAYVVSNG